MAEAQTAEDPRRTSEFIARWQASSAAERANYQLFLSELCDLLGVPRPDPAQADESRNVYVFEKAVTFRHPDDTTSSGRIDLYRRGCFVLEAKQGSETVTPDPEAALRAPAATGARNTPRPRRGTAVRGTTGWDDAMLAARGQAEQYVRALPDDNPPFIVVVDVGHSIELYSDFSRLGKTYTPFPDARTHRLFLKDLALPEVCDRLRRVWTDPLALDPARRTAKVTREIAARLAELAKSLENNTNDAEAVATFLMRCLFTLFAEDIGLMGWTDDRKPRHPFTRMLRELRDEPHKFPMMAQAAWRDMDKGGFSPVLREDLLRFNGGLFAETEALPLTPAQLDLLIDAAEADWKEVEPAIFGTLLERALSPRERHKLGAHYTPRAYVERLVLPTIIEPLREEWSAAQAAAVTLAKAGKRKEAISEVQGFLKHLCEVIVLDPACGSGNFLYVTLEHMKRLEGEVRDVLRQLGEGQELMERVGFTVDPHQLRGIELNPRAAAIADLVLWIGYLQWHFRTHGSTMPAEPVLKKFDNIECRDAVLAYDRKEYVKQPDGRPLTRWDGHTFKKHAVTGEDVPDETARVPVFEYINPRKAEWPKADYVVGNPPFVGNKRMRLTLSDSYVDALRSAFGGSVPDSADYVMYWWDDAARLIASGKIQQFGLITTNSITQTLNRRVVERHVEADAKLVFSIPDHPWVDATQAAAVRIAMTVAASRASASTSTLAEVTSEDDGDSEDPDARQVSLRIQAVPKIHADLTSGAELTALRELRANAGLTNQGVTPLGEGFRLTAATLEELGFNREQLPPVIKRYAIGRDLVQTPEERFIIDFFGLNPAECQRLYPSLLQIIIERVKPERDAKAGRNKDADMYAKTWWLFAKPREALRRAIFSLERYIATCRTSRHRVFSFLSSSVLPDAKIVAIGLSDADVLAVLSSRLHVAFAHTTGAWLGVGNDSNYNHSDCFNKFPFPACSDAQRQRIRELGEQLDAHRKRQQAAHPGLTITDMYNVLEKLRAGAELTAKDRRIHEQGLVSVLRQIHDDLDAAVFDAYGWPADLSDEQILERLVALNAERAAEEAKGLVRWLRPEFQNPQNRAAAPVETQGELALGDADGEEPLARESLLGPRAAGIPSGRSREAIPAGRGARKDSRTSDSRTRESRKENVAAKGKAGKARSARAAVAASDKKPWPETLPEQARALRAALAACAAPVSVDDLAARFTKARRDRIAELLDTLVSLGQARELKNARFVATG